MIRESFGLTQRQTAIVMRCHLRTWQRYETGKLVIKAARLETFLERAHASISTPSLSNQSTVDPQTRLRALMREHCMTYQQLAELVHWSIDTVKAKLKPISSRGHRPLTEQDFEYVTLKLAEQKRRT
jgi:hypothetical protein